jgi:hypothetical protein
MKIEVLISFHFSSKGGEKIIDIKLFSFFVPPQRGETVFIYFFASPFFSVSRADAVCDILFFFLPLLALRLGRLRAPPRRGGREQKNTPTETVEEEFIAGSKLFFPPPLRSLRGGFALPKRKSFSFPKGSIDTTWTCSDFYFPK